MPVTNHLDYRLTFGAFAKVLPDSDAKYQALCPSDADAQMMARSFFDMINDHGLRAAAIRVIENGDGVTAPPQTQDAYNTTKIRVWSSADMTVTETVKDPRCIHGIRQPTAYEITVGETTVYSTKDKKVLGGDWMKKFNEAADKVAIAPYESCGVSHTVWSSQRSALQKRAF